MSFLALLVSSAALPAQGLPAPSEPVAFLCGERDGSFDESKPLVIMAIDGLSKDRPVNLKINDPNGHLEGQRLTSGLWIEHDGKPSALLSNLGSGDPVFIAIAFLMADTQGKTFIAKESISRDFDGTDYRNVQKLSFQCQLIRGDEVTRFIPTFDALQRGAPK